MTEKLNAHEAPVQHVDVEAISRENLEKVRKHAEHLKENPDKLVEHFKKEVQQEAVSGAEYTVGESEAAPSHTFGAHKQLKVQNYNRTLSHIQSRLKGPEKGFSKVIHSNAVDKVSSLSAQTVARPLGLMVGGLFAFVGSLLVLLTAKHYGFNYNFSIFLLLFVGGYLLGTVLELFGKLLKRRSES